MRPPAHFTFPMQENPCIMGILNVTPDSFSDGGQFTQPDIILRQVDKMVSEGAAIIDIGGESTKPFADPVSLDEELQRVIPVIKSIRQHHDVPLSIDTSKSAVARQALLHGANIINDISACRFDLEMADVAREFKCPIIIMHMQGTPKDMQVSPSYENIIEELRLFFTERIAWLTNHGIPKERIIIDPGIGFGKTVSNNFSLLKHLDDLKTLGCPLLVGHSRKSFIGKLLDLEIDQRNLPTAILTGLIVYLGASIIRVHDVKSNVQALRLANELLSAP